MSPELRIVRGRREPGCRVASALGWAAPCLAVATLLAGGLSTVACRPSPAGGPAPAARAAGEFLVELVPDAEPVPVNVLHSWTVRVTTRDGTPITDAVVSVDGDMPEHRHGLPTRPEVTGHLGDGRYRVDGMKFSMPGHWVLVVTVWIGSRRETASFDRVLP